MIQIRPEYSGKIRVIFPVIVGERTDRPVVVFQDDFLVINGHKQFVNAHIGVKDQRRVNFSFFLKLLDRLCLTVAFIDTAQAFGQFPAAHGYRFISGKHGQGVGADAVNDLRKFIVRVSREDNNQLFVVDKYGAFFIFTSGKIGKCWLKAGTDVPRDFLYNVPV